jgi:hypothetical protein
MLRRGTWFNSRHWPTMYEPKNNPGPEAVIKRNRVKCLLCHDIIESRHVHEMVRCECGKIYTDGGTEYIKRMGDFSAMLDMTEYHGPKQN